MERTNITLINPNPDRILDALAEVWKLHLERETGMHINVSIRRETLNNENESNNTNRE